MKEERLAALRERLDFYQKWYDDLDKKVNGRKWFWKRRADHSDARSMWCITTIIRDICREIEALEKKDE